MSAKSVVGVLALALLPIGSVAQENADAFVGTWRFNPRKSDWSLPPREQVRRYELRPDGFLVFTLAGTDAGGNPQFIQAAVRLDGKPYPVYSQNNLPDFLASGKPTPNAYVFRQRDARTIAVERTRDGTPNEHQTHVVAADGTTMTVTIDGANPDGSRFHNVGVFDKQ